MMQSSDFGDLHHRSAFRRLLRSRLRRILTQGYMRPGTMVVGEVTFQNSAQLGFAENDHVIQTLAPDGADQSLDERILPRATRSSDHLLDPHSRHSPPKLLAINLVTISQQEAQSSLIRERLDDLLRSPGSRRVFGDIEVQYATPVVRQHYQDVQHAESRSRDGEEIN